jgi:hypothetical protein
VRVLITKTAVASAALLTAAGLGITVASASPALADPAGGGTAISGAVPGADACNEASTGSGNQAFNGTDASSWVEWTANSCNWLIEERSFCESTVNGNTLWSTSGVVKAVGLKDSSSCPSGYDITRGEKRTSSDGGTIWTTYVTFWTPS